MTSAGPRIERVEVSAYTVPTEGPEADGTLEWAATSIIIVEIAAGGKVGLGYTYSAPAAAQLVRDRLAPAIIGGDAWAVAAHWSAMLALVRNLGLPGISASAISAVDSGLWDLKARILEVPLAALLGGRRDSVPIYGSGGFTNYSQERLCEQLARWVDELGCRSVKMKVGRNTEQDRRRAAAARKAIGDAELMVDANGGYDRKTACRQAFAFADCGVTWFEEPVSSDDLAGLRFLREHCPPPIEIAAGEYAYEPFYVLRMLAAHAVDVMQLDATRCCGVTGFLRAADVADAHSISVSAHTAPSLHLAICCAIPRLRHLEWFHDHVRLEGMLFDGTPNVANGEVRPDLTRPGNGLSLKRRDAERFAA